VDVTSPLWIGQDFLVHNFDCGVHWWTSCLMLDSDLIVSLFVLVLGMDIVVGVWSLSCFSLALTSLFKRFGLGLGLQPVSLLVPLLFPYNPFYYNLDISNTPCFCIVCYTLTNIRNFQLE